MSEMCLRPPPPRGVPKEGGRLRAGGRRRGAKLFLVVALVVGPTGADPPRG